MTGAADDPSPRSEAGLTGTVDAADGAEGLAALLRLLRADEARSGAWLADQLGLTRAAVWKQVERLRALGLRISAQAGHGYRLAAPFDALDTACIRHALPAHVQLGDLAVHWRIDSTSSVLTRAAAIDPRDRRVVLAEVQQAGRGRRGRAWCMPLGGGVALSFLKRFDRGMAELAGLSLVAGIAAAEALETLGVQGVALKWPNDLVVADGKLGGLLVEVGGDALGPCHAVIGLGLNVRLDAAARSDIDQPVADLTGLCGDAPPSRNHIAAAVIARFVDHTDVFAKEGFAPFMARFGTLDALRDRAVTLYGEGVPTHGIARGVDARGALLVECHDRVVRVDGGEVSVRRTP